MSRVSLSITATSVFITQIVRLVWRTSTPEPIRGDGIIWTYIKDVTRYMPLFSKQGPFVLQLDNNVSGKFDGVYSSKFAFITLCIPF